MHEPIRVVPEDPTNVGFDVLRGELGTRTHYIHNALASADEPLSAVEVGRRAEQLARSGGYKCKKTTFAPQATRSHLVSMRDKPGRGFVAQVSGGRWQLTDRARQRIADPSHAEPIPSQTAAVGNELRVVDEKGRLLLSKEFAGAFVTVERVSETELRIRKAVVIAEDDLPFIEDSLKPLSDRDRDLFLALIDNPPEPTPAFRKAAELYKKNHG